MRCLLLACFLSMALAGCRERDPLVGGKQEPVAATDAAIEAAYSVPAPTPSAPVASANTGASDEHRCGWFQNPTPGNAWLTDRDGDWEIATQGAYEAEGDWPSIPDAWWVITNAGSHGYGCACIDARVDASSKRVLRIRRAQARPLSVCRRDPTLKEPSAP